MNEYFLIGLTAIIGLGVTAQWLAWQFRIPSILLLLAFGFAAGPVSGYLKPDHLFGDMLLPIASISLGIILFEGGMCLKLSELKVIGGIFRNLITIGAAATLFTIMAAAYYILGLDLRISLLLGSILVVTGPTVVLPLLRHIRPVGRISSILRWEAIMIDPIGAMLTTIIATAIISKEYNTVFLVSFGIIKTIFISSLIAFIGALIIIVLLKKYLIPDFLHNPITLMIVLCTFTGSNYFQADSGLMAVTIMGIVLANQKIVNIKHIIEFEETLRVLLIAILFIILTARLSFADLKMLDWKSAVFLAVVILISRPLTVIVSTIGQKINWKERLFLSLMAPRGIVAASVASIFGVELMNSGMEQAGFIVPLTFIVIVGTVLVYGVAAPWAAKVTKLAQPNPQGVLIAGAHSWARIIAKSLQGLGYETLLVDTNWKNISDARISGLQGHYGNILADDFIDSIDFSGIGKFLAFTSNNEVNSLAAMNFSKILGNSEIYQLAIKGEMSGNKDIISRHLRGRQLFASEAVYEYIDSFFDDGAVIKTTQITQGFSFEDFKKIYGNYIIPLFIIDEKKNLIVLTINKRINVKSGQQLVYIVSNKKEDKAVDTF